VCASVTHWRASRTTVSIVLAARAIGIDDHSLGRFRPIGALPLISIPSGQRSYRWRPYDGAMGDPIVMDAGEYSTDEVLEQLRAGNRVLVRTEFAGSNHEVVLRFDGKTYYCDTPTTLHRHEAEAEMRTCLEDQGYSRVGTDDT